MQNTIRHWGGRLALAAGMVLWALAARGQINSPSNASVAAGAGVYRIDPAFWSNARNQVISYDGLQGIVINTLLGADRFYDVGVLGQQSVSANIEAGRIWNLHESLTQVKDFYKPTDAAGDYDWHATAVGMVIGGYIPSQAASHPYSQLGIAPQTRLCSGAIATDWFNYEVSPGQLGVAFNITPKTFHSTYNHFFTQQWTRTVNYYGLTLTYDAPTDVINSSWGYDDPSGQDAYTQGLDGLARAHPQTTVVLAAGNSTDSISRNNNVGGPASGYNSIAVGAIGDGTYNGYSTIADFSSRGPQDYYDPVNGLKAGVRAPVSLVAPGTALYSAYYGGQTGDNAAYLDTTEPDPVNGAKTYYLYGLAGTSFAAPIVTGGVSLLASTSHLLFWGDTARDARVMKAVLMNSATKLPGWNNGQHVDASGAIVTTQSLDWTQGAGMINLDRAFDQYLSGTAEVAGTGGGTVLPVGWDYGEIALAAAGQPVAHNDYRITGRLLAGTMFDVTVTWFRDLESPVFTDNANPDLQTLVTEDGGFANLDLEVWNADFTALYAKSESRYNNTEHLHFALPLDGEYGIRVKYSDQVFGTPSREGYALVWAVPEPNSAVLVLWLAGPGVVLVLLRRRRQQASVR